ncbi:hypothetical protein [Kutzneria sp. 744]|uniref:hypothetical protein n=1 Tax=Kutzneria sp. (strain 744) TaxID=345341 RepID=UPI0003EEC49F|nr:hypothetical protein [Kutzneria sp. 744]EWM11849.1 hypothetical protein KUTG_02153 [Kutzneria sp. 744]
MPRHRNDPRWLGIGTDRYRWSVGHSHENLEDPNERDKTCCEFLELRRERVHGRVYIEFCVGNGFRVSDGWGMHSGQVRHADGRGLNLNQPGVVRALLDAAVAVGWDPTATTVAELDGWALFDRAFANATSGQYFPTPNRAATRPPSASC